MAARAPSRYALVEQRLERMARDAGPGARLAPIAAIARQLGSSTVTVSKAIRSLSDRGVLDVAQRSGIHVRAHPGQMPAASHSAHDGACSADRVATGIRGDIQSRALKPGQPVPGRKVLSARFGTSRATINRALRALSQAGLLAPHGRGYAVHAPGPPPSHATLELIAVTDHPPTLGRFSPRAAEFWRCLERECRQHRLRLVVRSAQSILSARSSRGAGRPLGSLVILQGLAADTASALIAALAARGRPVAILDEMGDVPLSPRLLQARQVLYVSMAVSGQCGYDIGAYLVSSGHRDIACFSINNSAPWCRNRTAGVRRAWEIAGGGAGTFSLHKIDQLTHLFGVTSEDSAKEPFVSLMKQFARFDKALGIDNLSQSHSLYDHAIPYMFDRYVAQRLLPLFEQALSERRATAWVVVTDVAALAALEFLRGKGVSVPGDIALAGFDDTVEAFGSGLTSYNFNVPAVVDRLLGHVLGHGPTHGDSPVELPGAVMERATTAEPAS